MTMPKTESRSSRRRERPATGITVEMLDLTKVFAAGRDHWIKEISHENSTDDARKWPESKLARLKVDTFGEVGIVRTRSGVFVLNTEGIIDIDPLGDPPDGTPHELSLWVSLQSGGEGESGWMQVTPFATFKLTLAQVNDMPVAKKIPLEEFVRRFGPRLEDNFQICLSHLKAKGLL